MSRLPRIAAVNLVRRCEVGRTGAFGFALLLRSGYTAKQA
jgi:hypothetical protein